jgi:hypothetical protein
VLRFELNMHICNFRVLMKVLPRRNAGVEFLNMALFICFQISQAEIAMISIKIFS